MSLQELLRLCRADLFQHFQHAGPAQPFRIGSAENLFQALSHFQRAG